MADRPASIVTYDVEERWLDEDLDLPYIDAAAAHIAGLLHTGATVEVAYQPGDGTRYPLVFVPLASLRATPGRVFRGEEWERHAVSGMSDRNDDPTADGAYYYGDTGYLIVWVEHGSYPLRLKGRGHLDSGYVASHWNAPEQSAVSLALLFRAIACYLDAFGA